MQREQHNENSDLLKKMPPEILNRIFALVLPAAKPVWIFEPAHAPELALLQTCRAVRKITIQMFYSSVILFASLPLLRKPLNDVAKAWIQEMPTEGIASLRKIRFDVDVPIWKEDPHFKTAKREVAELRVKINRDDKRCPFDITLDSNYNADPQLYPLAVHQTLEAFLRQHVTALLTRVDLRQRGFQLKEIEELLEALCNLREGIRVVPSTLEVQFGRPSWVKESKER